MAETINNSDLRLDDLEKFALMAIEEFLMKKNIFPETLDALRREWKRPDENESFLVWYDVASKLRLHTFHTINLESKSVLENIFETQIKDSSTKSRRPQSAIISSLLQSTSSSISSSLPKVKAFSQQMLIPNGIHHHNTDNSDRKKIDKSNNTKSMDILNLTSSRPSTALPITSSRKTSKPQIAKLYRKGNYQHDKCNKKPSNQNWIPESVRFEELNRNIRVAQENLVDCRIREKSIQYRNQHAYGSELEEAHAQERVGISKKIACACCNQMYLIINLPQSVSMKAIVDIRTLWNGNMKSSTIYNSNAKGILVRDTEIPAKVSSAYDQVRVCVFCAQFFHVQEKYRPSCQELQDAELKEKHDEVHQRRMEYWDPLKMCEKNRDELEKENPTYISAHSVR